MTINPGIAVIRAALGVRMKRSVGPSVKAIDLIATCRTKLETAMLAAPSVGN